MSMRLLRGACWIQAVYLGVEMGAAVMAFISTRKPRQGANTDTLTAHSLSQQHCQFAHSCHHEIERKRLLL
jgi:hypothetical protein